MYKICVLGDRESILGYSALGLDIFPAESEAEAAAFFKDTETVMQYAIIYVTETVAAKCKKQIEKYRFEPLPAIILIPDKNGSLGIGMADVKKSG